MRRPQEVHVGGEVLAENLHAQALSLLGPLGVSTLEAPLGLGLDAAQLPIEFA